MKGVEFIVRSVGRSVDVRELGSWRARGPMAGWLTGADCRVGPGFRAEMGSFLVGETLAFFIYIAFVGGYGERAGVEWDVH